MTHATQGPPGTGKTYAGARNARDLGKWDGGRIAAGLADGTLHVVGGTAWLRPTAAMAGSVDVLLVTEVGQPPRATMTPESGRAYRRCAGRESAG